MFNKKFPSTAAILVGGKGTRLQTVVSDVPKPLAMIAGEPFLFLLLRDLATAGIAKVILLTGYQHEKIVAACGDGKNFGLEIVYSRETEPLGTGGALLQARNCFAGADSFILLNGDTYIECSLTDFIQQDLNDMLGALGVSSLNEVKRYGSVKVNPENNMIEGFYEKSDQPTGLVSAGVYKFSTRLFSLFSGNETCSIESDILPRVIQLGEKISAFSLEGSFYDIGLPESYANFNASRVFHSLELHPLSQIILATLINKGKIWIISNDSKQSSTEQLLGKLKACIDLPEITATIHVIDEAQRQHTSELMKHSDLIFLLELQDFNIDFAFSKVTIQSMQAIAILFNQVIAEVKHAWENLKSSFKHITLSCPDICFQDDTIKIGVD